MPITTRLTPVRFTARGLADAFDATDKFLGACLTLQNLIFDQSNPEVMVSRPGTTEISAFAGFSTPGVISVQITVNDRTYGMIGTARNANKDEPFCYNHVTGAFETVAGVTNANTPTTQAASGAWTPPTMAVIGTTIVVTHPGFPGGATKFGSFDISTPTAPSWTAGDLSTSALPSVPTAVANFNNRAYYACGQTMPYSDVLLPLARAASSQALTVGDTSAITALSGLSVQTTSSGVVAALIVFKAFQVWQVTGDAASSNLALNYISLVVGCSAPRSVAQSPIGIYFTSISGPQIIDQLGVLRALTNSLQETEPDVQAPFQNASTQSRISGGYCAGVYRVSLETTIRGTTFTRDYWFHEKRRRWTGPHTFSHDCASQYGNYFILVSNANTGKLIRSDVIPSPSSVYTDLSVSITCLIQSSTFPKTGAMIVKQMVESTQELASAGGAASYQLTGLDEIGNTLNSCEISVAPAGSLWGTGVWGGFSWASSLNIPKTYTVPWTLPLVFKKMALYLTATASTALAIGTFYGRWKDAGYTNT